jgi:hypothetical protein
MLSGTLVSHVYEWITWNNDVKGGTFVSVPAPDFKFRKAVEQLKWRVVQQIIIDLVSTWQY